MAAHVKDTFEEICFIDAESNEDFKMIVSSRDANRARTDLTFATQLLQQARQQQKVDCSPQASTSSSQNESVANVDTTVECAKDAHAWTKKETLLLLELYREYQTKLVGGKGTVKKYWDDIAKLIQEKGYNVSGYKCSTKFQSLKRTYKSIADHNKKSGNNRKDWEYLQIMEELFGDKPWIQPLAVAGSHLREIGNENKIEDEEQEFSQAATKKAKMNTVINDYISFSKEERMKRREIRAKQHDEKIVAFKRMENLLERILEKENKSKG